jgi:hypothetical protein
VVVPAAYDIFDDWQEYFKNRKKKKTGEVNKMYVTSPKKEV